MWGCFIRIIVDTREQRPLEFVGHEIINKKLDEGDYNVEELKNYIVIERKSLPDLYGSIVKGHRRFRDELLRSRIQNKTFYLFLEGTLEEFYSFSWSARKIAISDSVLKKIVETTVQKYGVIVVECESRERMAALILLTIETNKKLYEV